MREVGCYSNVCSIVKSILDDPINRQEVVSLNTEFVNLNALQQVIKSRRNNREICADIDIDLSYRMKMYTGIHPLFKLRPYRTS